MPFKKNNKLWNNPSSIKYQFKKGSKGCPGKRSLITIELMRKVRTGQNSQEKSKTWKGEKAKHSAIHMWVRKYKGKASFCLHCKSVDKSRYHWANIDHKYRRNLDEYISLCPRCHKLYDMKFNGSKC